MSRQRAGRKAKEGYGKNRSERLEIRITPELKAMLNDMVNDRKKEGYTITSQADIVGDAIELIGARDGYYLREYES